MAAMSMMNNIANGANGATPRPGQDLEDEYEGKLITYIYDYFIRKEHFDCARALVKSQLLPKRQENDMNGVDDNAMQTDIKEDVDSKRPDDLPPSQVSTDAQGSFLLEWFALFWDVFSAQRKRTGGNQQTMQYVQHTQVWNLALVRNVS